jgi:hypothetical protein
MAISSAIVAPEPAQEPVAPFFKILMPNPMGTTEITALKTGRLCFKSVIAKRSRKREAQNVQPNQRQLQIRLNGKDTTIGIKYLGPRGKIK